MLKLYSNNCVAKKPPRHTHIILIYYVYRKYLTEREPHNIFMACRFIPYASKHQKNLSFSAIDLNGACKIVIVIYSSSDEKGHRVCVMHTLIF